MPPNHSSSPHSDLPDSNLPQRFGRFEVRRVLGQGGMGTVYAAEDPLIGRRVAIKEIRLDHLTNPDERAEMVERFKLEFRAAGTLSHPNIVTIYDVGEEHGAYFLAMEHVDGQSLAAVLKDAGRLETGRVLDLAGQIADGLDHAHDHGIVHRDVKPANILLTADGRPKITDFGLVKVMTSELTTTGTVLGTPAYMSPEQVQGKEVDGSSDQFSFAVLLYAMLTGLTPFRAERPEAILYLIVHESPAAPCEENADLPAAVDGVILRGLSKDPAARYRSCSQLVTALRRALEGGPQRLPSPTDTFDAGLVEAAMASQAPGDETRYGAGRTRATPISHPSPKAAEVESDLTLGSGTVADLDITTADPGVVADRARVYRSARKVPRWVLPLLLVTLVGLLSFFVTRQVRDRADGDARDQAAALAGAATETVAGVEQRALGRTDDDADDPEDDDANSSGGTKGGSAENLGATSSDSAAGGATPGPSRRELRVTSDPAGARVRLDGRELEGRTPIGIEAQAGEEYRVEVLLDGYESESWTFALDKLSTGQRESGVIHFPLRSSVEPGYLHIDAAYSVVVEVAGRRVGAGSRIEVPIPPGRQEVTVVAEEVFFRQTRTVEIESGRNHSFPTPHLVSIDIVASPGNCRVMIDGRDVGATPINDLSITVGRHEIDYRWPALGRSLRTVEVIGPGTPRLFGQPGG